MLSATGRKRRQRDHTFRSGRVGSAREWLYDMTDAKLGETSMRLQSYSRLNLKYP